jgi:hypothetical protein
MTPEDLAALDDCAASVCLATEHAGQRDDALLAQEDEPGWDAQAEADAAAQRAVLRDRASPGRRRSDGGAPHTSTSVVYVGRLHLRVRERILAELMMQVGPLRGVTMPADWDEQQKVAAETAAAALGSGSAGAHDPTDCRGVGCAVVTFQDPACATYAAGVMDSVALYGIPITVHAVPAGSCVGTDVCLRNLPHHLAERDVIQLVEAVVPLAISTRMLGEDQQGEHGVRFVSHGICFVTLTSVAFAADVIVTLDGRVLGACELAGGAYATSCTSNGKR